MKKLLKKILVLLVVVAVIVVGFKLITTPKKAEIGENVKYNDIAEFVVNDISVYENKLDLFEAGYGISGDYEDDGFVKIEFTIKNIGKEDFTVYPERVFVDYDDGVTYKSDLLFYHTANDSYKNCPGGFVLEKVTSDTKTFTMLVAVPQEIIENEEKSLDVRAFNHTYTVR